MTTSMILISLYILVSGIFFPFGAYLVIIKPWLKNMEKEKRRKSNSSTYEDEFGPFEDNVFHNPDAMNDGQYVCYLEKEVAYLYTMHRSMIDSYCTRFPTFDPASLMRVMEQTFCKITDLLSEYDQGKWTAQRTLDQLRKYTRELFGPNHPSNLSEEELADTVAIEKRMHFALNRDKASAPRIRSGSPFNQMLDDTKSKTGTDRTEKAKTRRTW